MRFLTSLKIPLITELRADTRDVRRRAGGARASGREALMLSPDLAVDGEVVNSCQRFRP